MKDANPDHYKVGDADFIKYMDDPKISGFGNWMFANGYNAGELAIVHCRDCKHRDPEDKKCDCGAMPFNTQILPVPDAFWCAFGEYKSQI